MAMRPQDVQKDFVTLSWRPIVFLIAVIGVTYFAMQVLPREQGAALYHYITKIL